MKRRARRIGGGPPESRGAQHEAMTSRAKCRDAGPEPVTGERESDRTILRASA